MGIQGFEVLIKIQRVCAVLKGLNWFLEFMGLSPTYQVSYIFPLSACLRYSPTVRPPDARPKSLDGSKSKPLTVPPKARHVFVHVLFKWRKRERRKTLTPKH